MGHAGTLDKFATGLLIVVTGWCTRLVPWFTGLDKRYLAEIRFGEETATLDPEGEVIATAGIPERSGVEAALEKFVGPLEQVPPAYSAVHASGTRAHKLARAGKEVDLPARKIEVYGLEIVSYSPPDLTVAVHCSKGTYVRSLARDIGTTAGSRAYVRSLRRTHVGPFVVSAALAPEAISYPADMLDPAEALSMSQVMHKTSASSEIVGKMRNGGGIEPSRLDNPPEADGEIIITDRSGELVSIVEKRGDSCRYRLVVPADSV